MFSADPPPPPQVRGQSGEAREGPPGAGPSQARRGVVAVTGEVPCEQRQEQGQETNTGPIGCYAQEEENQVA